MGCIRPCQTGSIFPSSAPTLYKFRNADECFFKKFKHFLAVTTRHDKRDDNFLAFIQLASIRMWLRSYESAA